MASNWTAFVAGDVLTAAQLNGVVDNFQDIAIFSEDQASGTEGGTFTSGAWQKRTLNTTRVNNIGGCTISSSVVTLATAGTYYIRGMGQAFKVNGHQMRIQNTTAATTAALGQTCYTANGDNVVTMGAVEGIITTTVSTNIELQHRCGTTVTGNGLGAAQSFGAGEVYAQLYIARIA